MEEARLPNSTKSPAVPADSLSKSTTAPVIVSGKSVVTMPAPVAVRPTHVGAGSMAKSSLIALRSAVVTRH